MCSPMFDNLFWSSRQFKTVVQQMNNKMFGFLQSLIIVFTIIIWVWLIKWCWELMLPGELMWLLYNIYVHIYISKFHILGFSNVIIDRQPGFVISKYTLMILCKIATPARYGNDRITVSCNADGILYVNVIRGHAVTCCGVSNRGYFTTAPVNSQGLPWMKINRLLPDTWRFSKSRFDHPLWPQRWLTTNGRESRDHRLELGHTERIIVPYIA